MVGSSLFKSSSFVAGGGNGIVSYVGPEVLCGFFVILSMVGSGVCPCRAFLAFFRGFGYNEPYEESARTAYI